MSLFNRTYTSQACPAQTLSSEQLGWVHKDNWSNDGRSVVLRRRDRGLPRDQAGHGLQVDRIESDAGRRVVEVVEDRRRRTAIDGQQQHREPVGADERCGPVRKNAFRTPALHARLGGVGACASVSNAFSKNQWCRAATPFGAARGFGRETNQE